MKHKGAEKRIKQYRTIGYPHDPPNHYPYHLGDYTDYLIVCPDHPGDHPVDYPGHPGDYSDPQFNLTVSNVSLMLLECVLNVS